MILNSFDYVSSYDFIEHSNFSSNKLSIDKLVQKNQALYENLEVNIKLIDKQFAIIDGEIHSIVIKSRLFSLIIGGITTFIGILLSLLINYKVSSGIREIDSKTIHLKRKDLTFRFGLKSSDELGRLSNTLNDFLNQLNSYMIVIQDTSRKNIETRNNLIQSVDESSVSVKDIKLRIQNIHNQSNELAGSVQESEEAVDLIIGTLGNLNQMIEEQVAMVKESSAAIFEIISSLNSISEVVRKNQEAADQLVDLSSQGGEKLEYTAYVIKAISQSIGEIQICLI